MTRTWSCECCQKTDTAEDITLSQREDPEVQEILNPKPGSRRLKRKTSAEKTIYEHGKQTIKGKRTQEDMKRMELVNMYANSLSPHDAVPW